MRFQQLLAALPLAAAAPLTERAENGNYIVVLKEGAQKPRTLAVSKLPLLGSKAAMQAGAAVAAIDKDSVWGFGSFKGFHATVDGAQVDALKNDPSVAYIVPNGRAEAKWIRKDRRAAQGSMVTQDNSPSWGLARLSSRTPGAKAYNYDSTAGKGACAYIIDTGIDAKHPEFEGRATFLKNFASNATTDDVGHGTHCAGTIGSKTYGVAKKAKLYGVKVLDSEGSGEWSTIISGIEYAVNHTQTADCPNGAVISMSLGGPSNQAVNDAVAAAVSAGVFVAVAAGNEATDAKSSSPASEPTVFTVGATDSKDKMADFSNYGKLVDIFAPGVDILSTIPDGKTETMSGTSMATPHIAGLAVYLLGLNGKVTPAQLSDQITQLGTKNAISTKLPSGTINLEAFNGAAASNSTKLDSAVLQEGFIAKEVNA